MQAGRIKLLRNIDAPKRAAPVASKGAHAARRAFLAADTDGDGTLDVGEMRTLAQSMGVHAGEELQTAIEQMDGDGDGEISVEEFVQWWCDTFQ